MADPTVFASVLDAVRSPDREGVIRIDDEFRSRYRSNMEWLLDRLSKSTAGVRGVIARSFGSSAPTLEMAEESPQLNLAVVAVIAQAYANYYQESEKGRPVGFIGFDGRYFSREYAELFARIFAGSGLGAIRDWSDEPTPTPVTSFMAVSQGLRGAVMITASHNPPRFNGIKSSTWYGGVDTDDISDQIARHVHLLTTRDGEIRLASVSNDCITEADAKQVYLDRYLRPTFDEASLAQLKQAMDAGARFLFDGLFGVGGMAIERYLDGLLPGYDWRRSVEILNRTPDPAIGGIEKPDPSDPRTLELSGAIDFLSRHRETLLSVTADMDADRIGTAVLIPASQVDSARRFGLFVSEFPSAGESIWAVRFTPNQLFTLIAYDRFLAVGRLKMGTGDPDVLVGVGQEGGCKSIHLITSIATSMLAENLTRAFGMSLHLTAVGFKNLGKLAYEIDETGRGETILCLMEESGGAQIGPLAAWSDGGDTIHRDKDTCALALALFCLAARLRNESRSLLEFYLEMARRLGSLCYYERLDAYLPDQATAEDPARQAEANQAKADLLERLTRLQKPECQEELLRLFGLRASGASPARETLAEISLLEKVGDEWRPSHPEATVHRLDDGGALSWFRGGTFDHDGMKITRTDSTGSVLWWCLTRASGTEAVVRVYMEVLEPVDAPKPEQLIEVFGPLLSYLGLDRCGLTGGGDSYAAAFAKSVRMKYVSAG